MLCFNCFMGASLRLNRLVSRDAVHSDSLEGEY